MSTYRWICICLLLLPAQAHSLTATQLSTFDKALSALEKANWPAAMQQRDRIGNRLAADYVLWRYYQKPNAKLDIATAITLHDSTTDWPNTDRVQRAIELRLFDGVAAPPEAFTWLNQQGALTAKGNAAMALYSKLPTAIRQKAAINSWVMGLANPDAEAALLKAYGRAITSSHQRERANSLLEREYYTAAERQLSRLSREDRKLYAARIALRRGDRGVDTPLANVPKSLQSDAGLLLDRAIWRYRKKRVAGVDQLIMQATDKYIEPDRWWPIIRTRAGSAMREQRYSKAINLLEDHGQTGPGQKAEALFLLGRAYLLSNKADKAYEQFYQLYQHATLSSTRARAAYHAGRAANANGNTDIARQWFNVAAAEPTTFYGQLGLLASGERQLNLSPAPINLAQRIPASIMQQPKMQLAVWLTKLERLELVEELLIMQMEGATTEQELAAIGAFGIRTHTPYLSVRMGKQLLNRGYHWANLSHPIPKLADGAAPVEFSMAIARQESQLKRDARSPVGARGLMQLMPGTAKETAEKLGIGYQPNQLDMPNYNSKLGRAYLGRVLDQFDQHHILAASGYNAGPGNARKWLNAYGSPNGSLDHMVDWIENIPFRETRLYVKRVLGNMETYRSLRGQPTLSLSNIAARGYP